MLTKLFLCVFLLIGTLFSIKAEYRIQNDSTSRSTVTSGIIDHSNVQKYIESHKMIVKKKPFSEGFRIQIYNGNNRDDANRIKSEFYGKFPGMRCYISYQQPYYKVKVGDYPDQSAARGDLKKMGKHYPSSFLVPDQIKRTGESDKEDKSTNKSN